MSGPDDIGQMLRREAERALGDIVSGAVLRELLDTRGRYDERYWRLCREQGWTAIGIPEDRGGIGLGLAELCVLAELGGGYPAGAPFLETGFVAAQAILRHGDGQWLPEIASGEAIVTVAIAEGNDPLPLAPSLRWVEGRLNGMRLAVPGGAVADLVLLLATADNGLALVLADLRAEGVARATIDTFDNSRCTADLAFRDVPAQRLGAGDAGAAAGALLDLQAVIAAHQQFGGAARMLAMARDHALERHAFGQPIGAFQSVKHRIAEGYILVELARAGAEEAVAAYRTPDFSRAAMAARLLATEAYETLTRDAMQVHGGIGVTWEADFHLHQRRARTLALELGPTLAWEDRLVYLLAEEGA